MRIGEFAQTHGVSTKMLRHYDAIGLFSPIGRDTDNGYRYYMQDQERQLKWILLLKQLGFSLESIKGLIRGDIHRDDLSMALIQKRMELAEALQQGLLQSAQIEALLNLIDREDFPMTTSIDFTKLDPEHILSLKNDIPTKEHLIKAAMAMASRSEHKGYKALLALDLSSFQKINEQFGYITGDRVLVATYQVLQQLTQRYPNQHVVARIGGDEFAIYLECDKEAIYYLADRLHDAVQALDYQSIGLENPIAIKISGIVTKGELFGTHANPDDIIAQSEQFLSNARLLVQNGDKGIVINEI